VGKFAKIQPLRGHEDICVYYKKQPTYHPQMQGSEFHKKRVVKHGGTEQYWGKSKHTGKWGVETTEGGHRGRYPSTELFFPVTKASPNKRKPSTRCNDMVDFFILTYSNVQDIVLDISCNDGIVLERCHNLRRKCIGIEISEEYCELATIRYLRSLNE